MQAGRSLSQPLTLTLRARGRSGDTAGRGAVLGTLLRGWSCRGAGRRDGTAPSPAGPAEGPTGDTCVRQGFESHLAGHETDGAGDSGATAGSRPHLAPLGPGTRRLGGFPSSRVSSHLRVRGLLRRRLCPAAVRPLGPKGFPQPGRGPTLPQEGGDLCGNIEYPAVCPGMSLEAGRITASGRGGASRSKKAWGSHEGRAFSPRPRLRGRFSAGPCWETAASRNRHACEDSAHSLRGP